MILIIIFTKKSLNKNLSYQQGNKFTPKELKDCPECGKPRISFGWCLKCETNTMKENFPYWTSRNKEIDELIRYTQLNACDYLEWIPFEKFEMVKYVGKGGFSSVYSALWMEGPRWIWDDGAQEWTRYGPMNVALKRLKTFQVLTLISISQMSTFCFIGLAGTFGITKGPTSSYMIVMKYYENGNLYQYLDHCNGIISWRDVIVMLWGIAGDEKVLSTDARISDVGLHGPCDYDTNNGLIQRYGVLPYVAPEVLCGENYSTAYAIYSFGIVMNTLATGKRPWYNRAHDINLAKDICNGKRLEIPDDTPNFYAELIQQCWDNDPDKRPTASY
ncbi:kinase-like protein [Rhizophagus irregularis]|uniref:Kinase-like protein n=1 Tax=Rhizophagus irregularis TaxID=588596 RepID=A0A2N0PGL1_9GLOM|nr:kinase-like protein [Rhizophagus irregularis]